MQIQRIVNNWIDQLKKHKRKPATPTVGTDLCCVTINPQGVNCAYVRQANKRPELEFCEFVASHDVEDALTSIVKKHRLQKVACSWMLGPTDYQLTLMEALPVPAAEFQSAIRWRIKEMVNYPVAEAVIDSFPMPPRPLEQQSTIYVVMSHLTRLQAVAKQINGSGLILTAIDIPELALRNIAALYEKDEQAIAIVNVHPQRSHLLIARQKCLYLSRHLELGIGDEKASAEEVTRQLEKLVLELQRSFGYYQSQWRQSAPGLVLLVLNNNVAVNVPDYLSNQFNTPVTVMDITSVLTSKQSLDSAYQIKSLTTIGGALRNEIIAHATAN